LSSNSRTAALTPNTCAAAGAGNPFAVIQQQDLGFWPGYGTVLKSIDDAPVFRITVSVSQSLETVGTLDVSGLVFDGNSTTAVVLLESFYGTGTFAHNLVFQHGAGNGLEITYWAGSKVHDCYFMNGDWAKSGLSEKRTGVGLFLNQQYDDGGLQTIRKCTSRGWNTAYRVGNGTNSFHTYSASIRDSESSCTFNGIHLTSGARATLLDACYFEGGDGGVGIWDQGNYNRVLNSWTFAGYGVHLKSEDKTYGSYYAGNAFGAGSSPNQVLASISAWEYGKVFTGNHLSFGGAGGNISGVLGLRINGSSPRVDFSGNSFAPAGEWVGGAGTMKTSIVANQIGFGIGFSGALEMPKLSQGAVTLAKGSLLTETSVKGGVLTIPDGSYFAIAATAPTVVNQLSCGGDSGRLIILRTENGNLSFQPSLNMLTTNKAAFTGPGTITFMVERIGATDYAYETARAVF
jgi:hypothetical protein